MGTLILKIKVISFIVIALLNFSLAVFVYMKNIQSKTHRYLSLTALFSGIYAVAYVMVYLNVYPSILFWGRFAYIGSFILPNTAMFILYFFQDNPVNIRLKKALFYSPAFAIFTLTLTTPFVLRNATIIDYKIIGTVGPLDYAARFYFTIMFLIIVLYLIKGYRKSEGKKKLQIKYFLLGTLIYVVGGSVSVVILPLLERAAVYTEFACFFSSIWVFLVVYAIIRHRLMEIDTVIHRTILWIATSLWLVIPAYVLFKTTHLWLKALSPFWITVIALLLFYIFLWYYRYFQPKIDHFFRRRKYDYQTILGKVAEKIATVIDIENLTHQLLTEVCETMYLRNSIFYVLAKDQEKYLLMGRRGYKEADGIRQRTALEIYTEQERGNMPQNIRELDYNNLFSKWLTKQKDILEKEQVETNPQYESIKQEILDWFREQDIELIVPVVLENEVTGLLGLGKKENLQAYTLKDLQLLKKLGQEVGVTLYNALHYEDLAEKERLDEELKMGRQIQTALLPQEIPHVPGLSVQGLMLPAKEIGGDYYDFIILPDKDSLGIVIGDVSGKGVSAGLIMSLTKATIHNLSEEGFSPREILLRTNRFLNKHIGGQKFMTLIYLMWQFQSKALTYSSAGHEHILVYRETFPQGETFPMGKVEAIQSGGFMLGMIQDIDRFLEEKQITLQAQDKILLYTDGVTEAENASGDRFGLSRLKETFAKHSSKSASELMQAIKDEVYTFIGNHPQYDDITLVVMEAR